MKRTLIIGLMLLGLAPLRAQNDSVPASQMADTAYSEEEYQMPNINPIYYFGSPFCEHFFEVKGFFGIDDLGVGITYTYLPEVWGVHVTGYTLNTLWVMAGTDYRLSKPWNEFDWHLYGSLGVFYDGDFAIWHPAMEIGARVASPANANVGNFCFNSGTLGLMTNFDGVYLTIGASISLSAIFAACLLLIQN